MSGKIDEELQELMRMEREEQVEVNRLRRGIPVDEVTDEMIEKSGEVIIDERYMEKSNRGESAVTSEDFNEPINQKERAAKVCDSCGGTLKYKPSIRCLECVFCAATYPLNFTANNIREIAIDKMDDIFQETNWGVETKTVECQNCGGKTVSTTDEKTIFCAFCGSQHIAETAESAGVKPQGLVPYEFDEKAAKEKFEYWIKRRWLSPNKLKKVFELKDLDGVYFPYWTFDTDAYSEYTVEVGFDHEDKDGNVTTDWSYRSGSYSKEIDDHLLVASESEYNKLFKQIEPFFTTGGEVVDYDSTYLVGYLARKYTVEPSDAWYTAREEIEDELADDITTGLPGDRYRSFNQVVTYSDSTFKYIMLPIYTMVYDYKGKTYNVLVNGQTGKVSGDAPYSWVKISLIAALIAFLIYKIWPYMTA